MSAGVCPALHGGCLLRLFGAMSPARHSLGIAGEPPPVREFQGVTHDVGMRALLGPEPAAGCGCALDTCLFLCDAVAHVLAAKHS